MYLEELAAALGPKQVLFLSQDDKVSSKYDICPLIIKMYIENI